MTPGRIAIGRPRAVRVLLALTAVSACLVTVAYAATQPGRTGPGVAASKPVGVGPGHGIDASPGAGQERLLRPRFLEHPEATSVAVEPQFRFHVPPRQQQQLRPSLPSPPGPPQRPRRFQCRLDNGGWRVCSSPERLTGLAPGDHSFAVRALNRAGRAGPAVSYSWRRAEPPSQRDKGDAKPFSIELLGELEALHPGFPPQQVPVLIVNPNPVPIAVTSLTVAIDGEAPGCAAENFAVTPSSASPTTPLTVPAGGSVSLPTATTSGPTIAMLNLAVDQDACQGAEIPLAFAGEAHG